jgi:carbonic anhydrase
MFRRALVVLVSVLVAASIVAGCGGDQEAEETGSGEEGLQRVEQDRAMSIFDELLDANADFAKGFELGHLPSPPARALAVLTCMDARILPLEMAGLTPGDAHVVRNAGGRASDDAIRSLVVSTHRLGVRDIAVVHHTACGMASVTDDGFRDEVERATGHRPDMPILAIDDPDGALRADVERLRTSPLFPEGTEVAGFLYDVSSGRLERRP